MSQPNQKLSTTSNLEDRHVDNIPDNFREQQSSEYNCPNVLPTVMSRDVTRRFE